MKNKIVLNIYCVCAENDGGLTGTPALVTLNPFGVGGWGVCNVELILCDQPLRDPLRDTYPIPTFVNRYKKISLAVDQLHFLRPNASTMVL